jgi:hypothetical protein
MELPFKKFAEILSGSFEKSTADAGRVPDTSNQDVMSVTHQETVYDANRHQSVPAEPWLMSQRQSPGSPQSRIVELRS